MHRLARESRRRVALVPKGAGHDDNEALFVFEAAEARVLAVERGERKVVNHAPDADIRTWTAQAGDILLIHPKTIHGAPPRRGSPQGRRLAFTLRWIGSDVVWRPNDLSFGLAPFDRSPLMVRDAPPPEELFPVVWRQGA